MGSRLVPLGIRGRTCVATARPTAGAAFLPSDAGEWATVLDAMLFHKAFYELGYELNNRPDWVAIPLRGIAQLLEP